MNKTIIQPKVTQYINCNVYSGDNYITLPKETKLHEVIQIAFESDFEPKKLKKFIGHFSGKRNIGINYDMGNSASYGYNPIEEFYEYGDSIINAHIKDRKFRGPTVRLGNGDVDFPVVFESFKKIGYQGDYILQTARSIPGQDVNMLSRNLEFINQWI